MKSIVNQLGYGEYQVVIKVGEGSAAMTFRRVNLSEGTWHTNDKELRARLEGWSGLKFSEVREMAEEILAKRYGVELEEEIEAEYVYDDGGRSKYFKANKVGDCVTRAVAIASGRDYKEIYDMIAKVTKRTPRNGVFTRTAAFKKMMTDLGFTWVACMGIGTGCKVHLKGDELPAAVAQRIITQLLLTECHDTYDSSRGGTRCVYGYWVYNN